MRLLEHGAEINEVVDISIPEDSAEKIQRVKIADMDVYKPAISALAEGVVVEIDADKQTPITAFPSLLDVFITQSLTSYSAWTTLGSQLVAPCAFIAQGLPGSSKVAAMLDGRWEQWGWSLPYSMSKSV